MDAGPGSTERLALRRYLADLEVAWNHAEAVAKQQIATGPDSAAIADCVRYALIRGSVSSLAANYEPAFVAQAVMIGLEGWSPQRALSITKKIADPERRAKMATALLEGRSQKNSIQAGLDQSRIELAQVALAAALAFDYEWYRSSALAALAPQLAEAEQITVLQLLQQL